MKTTQPLAIKTYQLAPELEQKLKTGEQSILEQALKNGHHLALQNRPALTGDSLENYTGVMKARCEKLSAEMLQALQPAPNISEAKIDADYFKAKDFELNREASGLEKQNQDDQFTLGEFNPLIIKRRVMIGLIVTAVILLGEVIFNVKAFQITGDSLLFALLLSVCTSFAVYLLSHATPLLYKYVNTTWKRRMVIASSLLLVIGLFTALAIFRSEYLAAHEVHIKPVYFVIINLFFFIVATLVSFFVLPTWAEIRENESKMKIHIAIQKRIKEIKGLNDKREEIKEEVSRLTKERLRILHLSEYVVSRIGKIYKEAIAEFKATNLNFRSDRQSPDCFKEEVPEMQVDEQAFRILKPAMK